MTAGRRIARVLAILSAAVLVLTGCATTDDGPLVDDAVAEELRPFYEQTLDWAACGDDAQCADLTVPLDWDDPQGETITVAVTRHRAAHGTGRALVMNPGGPGAPALDYVRDAQYRDYFFGDALQDAFDLVSIDPRGVHGESSAVRCYDAQQMDHYLYDLPQHARGTAEYRAEADAGAKAFGAACQSNTGALLEHVDTVSVARDLDALRAVLGQSTLDYLGYSYGTRIGAVFADLFPQRVGSFVLDGAVDPSLSAEDMAVEQTEGFAQAARSYLDSCVAQRACPFTGTTDEAEQQLADLVAGLDAHPLTASDGRRLGSATMLTAISAALYARTQWSTLSQALTDVRDGDPTGAMALADSYYARDADGTYEDNSTEVLTAVNCIDLPTDQTEVGVQRLDERLREAGGVFGELSADGTPMCDQWPVAATGSPHRISATGSGPIMVIGTTGDPATPYAWAQSLADQLDEGFLVTNVGEGHTAYRATASTCVTDAVERFLVDGTRPEEGLRCS